ncbi:hypothetical protein DBR32_00800 [Taibaiella sp. KBW10]|uniref:hypothetical protein n=1 Tax=Taibaiella sp. KBW10 TaxID=2153357 RepID=UPI000F5A6A0B|nr:hypothetical protein [Taibaiella sp. KBW10]RQO32186.1 hypothetical protein DBR32_00800 [Taibaiella sp. KBW10]
MNLSYTHKYDFGLIQYGVEGIAIKPRLSKLPLFIPWENIAFISPTPSVKETQGTWQTFEGKDLMAPDVLNTLEFFYIDIVLKNRHQLKMPHLSLWQSMRFWMGFPDIKPTYGADDQPKKNEGFLRYRLKKNSLNRPLAELLSFLAAHTKYDLLCSLD